VGIKTPRILGDEKKRKRKPLKSAKAVSSDEADVLEGQTGEAKGSKKTLQLLSRRQSIGESIEAYEASR